MHVTSRTARAVGLGAIGIATVVLTLSAYVRRGALVDSDLTIARHLNAFVSPHPGLVAFWKAVTVAGSPVVWDVLVAAAALVLCLRRRVAAAAAACAAVLGAAALSSVLKVLVGRPRPTPEIAVAHASGMSFPSGHALTSFVAAGVLGMVVLPMLGRRVRAVLASLGVAAVVAIGFSRLILGVHYLTDVLGAWCIGALWLAAVIRLLAWGGGDAVADDSRRDPAVTDQRVADLVPARYEIDRSAPR